MGNWQGDDLEEIPPSDNPREANTQQRRADMYRRIKELGHPALFDSDEKEQFARKYDISYRQVHYDLDAVAEYISKTLDREKHVTDVTFVFEKAMSEAIDEGDWETAADIAMQQSEWLERRGVIDNEDVQKVEVDHEHDWRQFIESGDEATTDAPVEVVEDEQ